MYTKTFARRSPMSRFIDKTDPSDFTRSEDFWIDTLKTHYPQGLNNIDPYHQFLFQKSYQFPAYLRNMFILVLLEFFIIIIIIIFEFINYRLFLFLISPLVRQVHMLSTSEDFFWCLSVLSLVCLFCCFYLCLVTTQDIVPFHLGIVVQEIEIVQKAFC